MVVKVIQHKRKLKELGSSLQNSSVSGSVKVRPAVLKLLRAFRQKDTARELNGRCAGFWLLLKVTWLSHKLHKTQNWDYTVFL
jgi:hypothetical protein